MTLIAYGDELAAASYTAVEYAWANQDQFEIHKGLRAHPVNIPHGFAYKTAELMHCGYHSAAYRDTNLDVFIQDYEKNKNHSDLIIVATWSKAHVGELKKIEAFGQALVNNNIPVCFINHSHLFKSSGSFWLWDPSKITAKTWATKNQLLNTHNYISSYGHTKLANLVLLHLTNQITNLIIEE